MLANWLSHKPNYVAVDWETEEFDWKEIFPHNAKPVGLSFCYEYDEHLYNEYVTDLEVADKLLNHWYKNRIKFVVFNSYFDIPRIEWRLGCRLSKDQWEDCYILSKLNDENVQGGLKAVYAHLFSERVNSYKKVDRSNAVMFAEYAKKDSFMTKRIYDVFYYNVPELFEDSIYDLEKELQPIVVNMNAEGMDVNYNEFLKIQMGTEKEISQLLSEFQAYFPYCNPNSTKQLTQYFNSRGIYSPIETKTGAQSWGAQAIQELIEHPEVTILARYKKLAKFYSAFIEPLNERLHHSDIIYASFNPMGTVTGRFSCSNPNFQQIPAHGEAAKLKGCFIPKNGLQFICGDLSQIELRLLAHYSKDPNLIRAYTQGLDVHTETAKLMFDTEEPTKEQRFIAKTIGFSVVYGISPEGLMRRMKIFGYDYTLGECQNFINLYLSRFPKVESFILNVGNLMHQRYKSSGEAYIKTLFGRTRHFRQQGFALPVNGRVRRQAVNFVIQGTAADIAKQMMIALAKAGFNLVAVIHDCFIVEGIFTEEDVQRYKKVVEDCTPLGFSVPLIIEPVLTDRWV